MLAEAALALAQSMPCESALSQRHLPIAFSPARTIPALAQDAGSAQ